MNEDGKSLARIIEHLRRAGSDPRAIGCAILIRSLSQADAPADGIGELLDRLERLVTAAAPDDPRAGEFIRSVRSADKLIDALESPRKPAS